MVLAAARRAYAHGMARLTRARCLLQAARLRFCVDTGRACGTNATNMQPRKFAEDGAGAGCALMAAPSVYLMSIPQS